MRRISISRRGFLSVCGLLGLGLSSAAGAQQVSELFSSDEVLEFVLTSDFDQLKKDRGQESDEIPGQVEVLGAGGESVQIPIQVKTRGKFRLQRRICPDPPLRLNFPESEPHGTVFDGQDKLKLVSHCRDSDRYEQNLLEEYLAYRIYNHLTEISFRVQLARITYRDTSGKNDPIERMAFLIEDEEAMAARLGGTMIEAPTALPTDFDLDQLSLPTSISSWWGTWIGAPAPVTISRSSTRTWATILFPTTSIGPGW